MRTRAGITRFAAVGQAALLATGGALAVGCGGGGGGGGAPGPSTPSTSRAYLFPSPGYVSFDAVQGGTPASATVSVAYVGSGSSGWRITSLPSWLTATPTSGPGNTETLVTLRPTASGLAAGFYAGMVSLQDLGTDNVTSEVHVDLTVSPAPPGIPALGITDAIRVDLGGPSVPAVSLQDRLVHLYRAPAVAGVGMTVSLNTSPPASAVSLRIAAGGTTLFSQAVTAPFSTSVTPSQDSLLSIEVYDGAQANVSLSSLTVTPASAPFDRSGFDVVFHFCGDLPFVGQTGVALGYHNGLATVSDRAAFVADLTARMNALFPTQVQIKSAGIGRAFSNSELTALHPLLVNNGVSRLHTSDSARSALTAQGAPSTDPVFGKAVDVFVMHSEEFNSGITGICQCALAQGGGVMVGAGSRHGLLIRLFEASTQTGFGPRPLQDVANTLTHELGHFLRLFHTTEQSFQPDDILDTPVTVDTNGNGDFDDPSPDANYVMYPFAGSKTLWSPGQIEAMRDFLSIREH